MHLIDISEELRAMATWPVVRLQVLVACWACWALRAVHPLGSMSSMAASYGENGQTLCTLSPPENASVVTCFGSDVASVYGAPPRLPLLGLTGGDGFVCGLSSGTRQPYCWGNNIYVKAGVPADVGATQYAAISAGDNHLCALRAAGAAPAVDCWGYNMTGSFVAAPLTSITSGSFFSCGLFAANATAVCWGDETGSGAISYAPRGVPFKSIAAGGYHVCGIVATTDHVLCWGRSLDAALHVPKDSAFAALVAGKFLTCGLARATRLPQCWGLTLPNTRPIPSALAFAVLVAGDYFICGAPVVATLPPQCWGSGLPVDQVARPAACSPLPCAPDTYSLTALALCPNPRDNLCLNCSKSCPQGTIESSPCSATSDRQCSFDCARCNHNATCSATCATAGPRAESIQIPIIIGELVTAVVVIGVLLIVAFFCVRRKLTKVETKSAKKSSAYGHRKASSITKTVKPLPSLETKVRARAFSYRELEDTTRGFAADAELGRGVHKGELRNGTLVAVKRHDAHNFTREIDLLSRLNHAHLLNLIGFCDEDEHRFLVHEFMPNGTLFQHLHSEDAPLLNWITRVKIAVQAARGVEYLHGYACPPVVHGDIRSSNILLDADLNARVALRVTSSDPTSDDVYSFGVLLLELLTGRVADAEDELVEWAVLLIKRGEVSPILDARLAHPEDSEGLMRVARVAARCVRAREADRPSMDRVTTSLERSLALLMGTMILPSEVVLGSSRLHPKPSRSHPKSSRSHFSSALTADSSWQAAIDQHENPSAASSSRMQRRWCEEDSELESDLDCHHHVQIVDEEKMQVKLSEIAPASPQPA